MSESIPSDGPLDRDAECRSLLEPFEEDSMIEGWLGWLEEGEVEELNTVFVGIEGVLKRREFLLAFKKTWPNYDHARYITQIEGNNPSVPGNTLQTRPSISNDHFVNKLIDLILESVSPDGLDDDEPLEEMVQDAEKINVAATIYHACGKQSVWLLRMVDFHNPHAVKVSLMSEEEVYAQHFLEQGLVLEEHVHLIMLERYLKQKSPELLNEELRKDFPDVVSTEKLCEIICFAAISDFIHEYQRSSGTSTPEALSVAHSRKEAAQQELQSMVNALMVFEEFDIDNFTTRLRPYVQMLEEVVRIGWLLKRDPSAIHSEEDSLLARKWYAGFLIEISTDELQNDEEDGGDYVATALRSQEDYPTGAIQLHNDIELLATDEFIERFSRNYPLFDLLSAAESVYGAVTISMGEGVESDPADMLEMFICGQISTYETLLGDEDLPGLPRVLRVKRDQYMEAASLRRGDYEDPFWLFRILDDIYSETTSLRVADLTDQQLQDRYLAEFGRTPAEEDYFGDLVFGDDFEDILDEVLDATSRYFPEEIDTELQRAYVVYHLHLQAVAARAHWEATRPCMTDVDNIKDSVDKLLLRDSEKDALLADDKFKLKHRRKLMRIINVRAAAFGKQVAESLFEAFGVAH